MQEILGTIPEAQQLSSPEILTKPKPQHSIRSVATSTPQDISTSTKKAQASSNNMVLVLIAAIAAVILAVVLTQASS